MIQPLSVSNFTKSVVRMSRKASFGTRDRWELSGHADQIALACSGTAVRVFDPEVCEEKPDSFD